MELFSRVVLEEDGTGLLGFKIGHRELAAVEKGERDPIGEEGTEFFHQVERQGWAARAVAVEKSTLGIETAALKGAAAIVHEQRIEE